MMDKTDKVLKQLSRPEPVMAVPIGSDVIIPNHSGITGNSDANAKLTLQKITDNGATTDNDITILNEDGSGGTSAIIGSQNSNRGNISLYSNGTEVLRLGDVGNNYTLGSAAASCFTVGSSTAYNSARLAIDTTSRGFLPPRMSTAQKNAISSPATGLMVFDTNLAKLCVYTGAAWETITSA